MMLLTTIAFFSSLIEFFGTTIPNVSQVILSIEQNKDNPDNNLNTLQIIRRAGYPAEAHVVLTEDGYLLTMHRIPGNKNFPPVLLQPGIFCSSIRWVILGKKRALAYLLADQGYDVWLGNFRGYTYSKAHVSLSPSDPKFWDFSIDEMGMYDLPAMITYITNLTSQPLHTYIGHSMGTTSFYVMAIKRPEIATIVRLMISLAPVAFVEHIKCPIRYLTFLNFTEEIVGFLNKFISQNGALNNLIGTETNNFFEKQIYTLLTFYLMSFDKKQFDYTLLPVSLADFPSYGSIRPLLHYIQEIKSGKFCAYDYGPHKNMQRYNAIVPPDYNLSRITTPIALFHANDDWFVSEKDLKKLRNLLTNIVDDYRVPLSNFDHLDFLWAKDAPALVYERILEIMKKEIN